MATKKSTAVKSPTQRTRQERIEHAAKVSLLPSANAAAVIAEYAKPFGEQDVNELMVELRDKFDQVENGDLHLCEAMLVGQANALQSIFVSLARKAVNQEYLKNYETFLRLALKAQNQSRMTLETLATMKTPPVVIARQANINHGSGNQQVNNGTPAPATHAREIKSEPNQLLEAQHGSTTLDTRATSRTSRKDKAMAAVE